MRKGSHKKLAGWKLRVKRLFSLFFLACFILQILTPFGNNFFNVTPVLADEAEEEDGFRQMPNFRWRNISTTSGSVSERLITDIYQIQSVNNPSGSATFRKGRTLNSRDFYFNSRFALDVGGSEVEVFQDERGDACDWEEGDYDGVQSWSGGTLSLSVTGFLNVSRNVPDDRFSFEFGNMVGMNLFTQSYRYIEFRIRAYGASQYDFRWEDYPDDPLMLIEGPIPTEWTEYRIDLWEYPDWLAYGEVGRHAYSVTTDSSGSYLIDYIRYIGVMDYASFYQGEIEDAWDFDEYSDTLEYYDDVYGNKVDFNTGGVEVYNVDWLSENMYLEYLMNTGSGTTYYDTSGNGWNAQTVSAPDWDSSSVDSEHSWCLDFEESNSDYIYKTDISALDFNEGSSTDLPMSFSTWIKLESYDSDSTVFSKGLWQLYIEDGDLEFEIHDFDNYNIWIKASFDTKIPEASSWIHLAVTYSGNEDESGITVYMNGVNDTATRTDNGVYDGHKNNAFDFRIGQDFNANYLDGKLDNFRVFNRELSSAEVFELYSNEPSNLDAPKPTISNYDSNWLNVTKQITSTGEVNATHRYKMNTGSGDNVFDSIGSQDGTGASGNWINSPIESYGIETTDFPSPNSIRINDHDSLTFLDEMSVDFWFNKTADSDQGSLIMKSGVGASEREYDLWVTGSESLVFRLTDSDGDYIGRSTSGSVVTVNKWSHIAASYDGSGSSSGIQIHINGSRVDTTDVNSGIFDGMSNTGENVYIGGEFMGGHGHAFGEFDEVRFYATDMNEELANWCYENFPEIPRGLSNLNVIYTDAMNPAIDRDTYEILELELTNIRGTIDYINVYNSTRSLMFSYLTDISQGSTQYLYLDGSSDWTGTSLTTDFLYLEVTYIEEASDYTSQYHLNYTNFLSFGGPFDDWGNVDDMFILDDKFYHTSNSSNDLELLTLRNIPSQYFENFRIRIKGTENGKYQLKAYDGSSWVNMTDMISFSTSWEIHEQSLRLVYDWYNVSNQRKLGLQFYNSSGMPIDEFNVIGIDYIQLIGHFDEDQGFKFGLWTEDDVEGMYFKFARRGAGLDETYVLIVDMLDSTGIALHFEEEFAYNRYTDGWLRFDLDFHLDKKKTKLTFEYENGTDIIKTRSISYFYPKIPAQLRLLLLTEGYPALVMDNTISGFSKSIIWIDYIDADWQQIEWFEDPTGSVWDEDDGAPFKWYDSGYPYQDDISVFTGINPYGLKQRWTQLDGKGHYYWTDIDRLDGFKFDVRMQADGLDYGAYDDYLYFFTDIYEVKASGDTQRVVHSEYFIERWGASSYTTNVRHYDWNGNQVGHVVDFSTSKNYIEGSYSFFRESEDILILQDTFDNGDVQGQNAMTFRKSSGKWSQEFVVMFYYFVNNTFGGWNDDHVNIEVRGFDVQRKDILGGIVAAILSPILFVLGIILTPIILILQALMIAFAKLFGALLAGLVSALAPILQGIITALGSFLEPIISFVSEILDIINEIMPLLVEVLIAAIEEWFVFFDEFTTMIISGIIWPLLEGMFESLGLLPLLEFILTFVGDLMLIIGDVIALVTAFFAYLFSSALFWFDVGRLGALGMWLLFFVVVYVFSPLISLWQTDFDKLELDQIMDSFGMLFERVFSLVLFMFNFTTYLFSFIFDVLKTIGNYIPFT